MLEIKYEQQKEKIYKIINFYVCSLSNIDKYSYESFIVSFNKCYCYRLSKLLFDDVYVRYELSVSSDCSTLECYIVNELECFSTVFRIDLNAAEVEDLLK